MKFSILNWWWNFKKEHFNSSLYTEGGTKVRYFPRYDRWAVCSTFDLLIFDETYKDQRGNHSWNESSAYFSDCLLTLEKLEEKYGKVLGFTEKSDGE